MADGLDANRLKHGTQNAERAQNLERARGSVMLAVARTERGNSVADLAQAGCGRLLFPAVGAGRPLESVVVNTAGGLTGGDHFAIDIAVADQAAATLTTQACEKIYRSSGADAVVETRLAIGAGASLAWLPQETILFDRSRLRRKLDVTMAADASLLVVEAVLLGRRASGETLREGLFRDSWRIRRDGRLVYADETGFSGDLATAFASRTTLRDNAAMASLVLAKPDAEGRLEGARAFIDDAMTKNTAMEAGISTFDGLCVVRMIAQDGAALRRELVPLIRVLGCEVPLVWSL